MKKREQILGIKEGDHVFLIYCRKVRIKKEKKREFHKRFGRFVIFKWTKMEFDYDSRHYFTQILQEQHQYLSQIREKQFLHLGGALYTRDGVEYMRFAIPEDRITMRAVYSINDMVVEYRDIEPFLYETEKEDYKCYNRQMGITSTGRPPKKQILFRNLKLRNIKKIEITKGGQQ